MIYKIETKELIQQEHEYILQEIRNLEISLFQNTVEVESILILTFIDGKVFNYLNDNKRKSYTD